MSEEKKNEYKFFDVPIAKMVRCNIDYEVNELRRCLESEGIVLSFNDTLKTLDIYCRVSSLDRPVDNNIGVRSIKTVFAPIKFKNFADKMAGDTIKDIVKGFNDIIPDKDKIVGIESLLNNISTVFKECSIFMNEIMDNLYNTMIGVKDSIAVSFYSESITNPNLYFVVKCSMINGISEFIFELDSTALVNKEPKASAIIINSFDEENREVIRKMIKELSANAAAEEK